MEIKAELQKPYTNKEKMDFIIQYNHGLGYTIEEADNALLAWGYTEEEKIAEFKKKKYLEATEKAKDYLAGGEALYEFEKDKHIEASDGNIAKMTAYALVFITEQLKPTDTVAWNTKEDETVKLNQEQISQILAGLGQVQAGVWNNQFPSYLRAIEQAKTVEEVEAIKIDYTNS